MYDDEQQLIRMFGNGAWLLQVEQPVEREIRAVGQLVGGIRRGAQKVATSRAVTSSTRIISVVKYGSP